MNNFDDVSIDMTLLIYVNPNATFMPSACQFANVQPLACSQIVDPMLLRPSPNHELLPRSRVIQVDLEAIAATF